MKRMIKPITNAIVRYVPLALVAVLAVGTWWMVERARMQQGQTGQPVSPLKPDFFVENLRLWRLDKTAQSQTYLTAERMTHIPQTQTATLYEPRIINQRPDRPEVTITARRGELVRPTDIVHFYGAVFVQRAPDAQAAAMILRTEQLTLRTDDDVATSDVAFQWQRGADRMDGVGFELNNAYRTLLVKNYARGFFANGTAP